MILDSPEQKKLLQDIVESTTFSAKPESLGQVAVNVQALRVALSNAELAPIEDVGNLELASETAGD